MSLAELKEEVAKLPAKEQRELMAYMVALHTRKDHAFQEKLAAKIDDRDPTHWVDLETARKRFTD